MIETVQSHTISLFKKILNCLQPTENITLSEWADKYRRLPPEGSAEPGLWQTSRTPYLKKIMDCLTDTKVREVIMMTCIQVGKALCVDTPIPTPYGWSTMGQLKTGDLIFDERGQICRVNQTTPIMYGRDCYKVVFSDKSEIIADADHLWEVQNLRRKKPEVLTTSEIAKTLHFGWKNCNRYAIPTTEPLMLKEANLLIEPYVLGVWLGDGHSYSAQFTTLIADLDTYKVEFARLGYLCIEKPNANKTAIDVLIQLHTNPSLCSRGHNKNITGLTKRGYCAECSRQDSKFHQYGTPRDKLREKDTFHRRLTKIGVLANKHIPIEYLRGSYEQRMALLRGLMDTDGYCNKKGVCQFDTSNPALAEGFADLLAGLGIKFTKRTRKTYAVKNGHRKQGADSVQFTFTAYSDMPVFRLERKYSRQRPKENGRPTETKRRWIVSVQQIPSVPVKCITVNSESRLFLAGKNMIPTHNSELLLNAMGYYIHIEPSTILIVQPTVDAGKKFSKERISPTIRDTTVLKNIIGSEKSRDAKNTVMQKLFPGGYAAIVGANSPTALASRPIKILLCDEIDRWPESAKKEGDPLSIVEKRTATFPHTKKILKVSTPTIDGISRIQHEFKQGTMEVWKLPCPICGISQELCWAHIIFMHMKDEETGKLDKEKGEIMCKCESCGELSNEVAWKSGNGDWFSDIPNDTIKSFKLSALVSPWITWTDIVEEFLKSKGDSEMIKVWTNTLLGEVYSVGGDSIDFVELLNRREKYNAVIPDGVLVLTAGVDVQDTRFELEVVGWGENKKSWGIEYKIIHGNTALPETWERLEQHLTKTYTCADGAVLNIHCTAIDSGGHRTTETYEFCKPREWRLVYAIKGKGGAGMNIIHTSNKTKRVGNTLVTVAVDTAKSILYTRLKHTDKALAGYCHFPIDTDAHQRGYDEKYFEGLTSETKITKMVKGRPKTEWIVKTGLRNEPLDCRVYNIAALEIIFPHLNFEDLKKRKGAKSVIPKRPRGAVRRREDI